MMLIINNLSFRYPGADLLFNNISFTVNSFQKIALIGNNGTGKSTLLKILAGKTEPQSGEIISSEKPCYVPQVFGQLNHLTIAQALQVDDKLNALQLIMQGDVSEKNYEILGDDWTIEERCAIALSQWKLPDIDLSQKMETLSGGQKTKVLLAGIAVHSPQFILLDEPTNHLDAAGRQLLYDFVEHTKNTLLLVSHDRQLLNLADNVYELNRQSVKVYGGNYDFYSEQKEIESEALLHDLHSKEKALRKAKEKEQDAMEQQQKLNSRGKAKQEKARIAKIMMNTLRNNAEKSSSKLKSVHQEKITGIAGDLKDLRAALPNVDTMKFGFDNSALHKGKILVSATGINFSYDAHSLFSSSLSFHITSGDRVWLQGDNGSGKTTLVKLILGSLQPSTGAIHRAFRRTVYIDQEYGIINQPLTVYEQLQQYNQLALQEHELKIRLTHFLFRKEDWNKSCLALSGGERMRLVLCCLTLGESPDIIILDEPTNNLDIQNIDILTAAIRQYEGTLIIVSHDKRFIDEVGVERVIKL